MGERPNQLRRAWLLNAALLTVLVVCAGAYSAAVAPGQTLQERLSETEDKLNEVEEKEGVLTTDIAAASERISTLQVQVADLRNKEAVAAAELAAKQKELDDARARLVELRARLQHAVQVLEDRLVAIYKSGDPDLLTVVLEADGFDDVLERTEYLERLEEQDSSIIGRVRVLRNEMQETVQTVRAARDEIARREAELEKTRTALEARTADLAAARAQQREALGSVRDQKEELEGDLSAISEKIEDQLAEIGGGALPAGPIRGGAAGFIWPVNGPVTSGFGYRWGRMHEGVDIGVGSGTPIRAVKSGDIVLAAPTSGYGNYTCISHGGGLSSCYAHQSSFARTSGSISQGEILGYVGCTGHCFGDHLHFEIRINGSAVDPLGYL